MSKKKMSKKRRIIWGVVICLVCSIPIAMTLLVIIPSRTFQFGGTIVPRVNTKEKVVALTFDDGPYPNNTGQLISTLKKADVPATFFLIGVEIQRHPAEAKQLVDAGFEIGNHSYRHDSLVFKSVKTIANDIESTDALIRKAGYTGPIQFRPPYGHKLFALPYYLSSHGRVTIMWDVAPDTNSSLQSPQSIVKNVLNGVHPGSIVVMHGMYNHNAPTRAALSQVIVELRNKGYRFVTVSQLLTYH